MERPLIAKAMLAIQIRSVLRYLDISPFHRGHLNAAGWQLLAGMAGDEPAGWSAGERDLFDPIYDPIGHNSP
jgi:hypothetical protein